MLAVAAHPGSTKPTLVDVAAPAAPGEGEILCRTLELGVCGTDREILQSARPFTPQGAAWLVLGHECLARVEETGAGVSGLRAGDLVVPLVRRPIGKAAQRVDMLSFGQYTERGIVHEHGFSMPLWIDRPEHVIRAPQAIADVAVFTEPLAVAEKGANEAVAIQRGRLGTSAWTKTPPRVLVTGMGPIGFAAVLASRCRGWQTTLCGRDEEDTFRARLAQDFGAAYCSTAQLETIPADIEQDGYDLVLECTGNDEVMLLAARHLASRGVLAWLGSSRQPHAAQRNTAQLMRDGVVRNHVHVGCVNAAPRDFADALAHLEQAYREAPELVKALITTRVAPKDSLPHYEGREAQGIKVVLEYL